MFFENPFFFNIARNFLNDSFKTRWQFIKKFRVRENEKLIDIGCGTGEFSKISCNYIGIDISKEFIAFAKKKFENSRKKFFVGNATGLLPFSNKSFDKVMLIDFFHHLCDSDVEKAMQEACRLAKGKILIIDMLKQKSFFGKILVFFDNGKFARDFEEEKMLIEKFLKIEAVEKIRCGFYDEIALIGEPKN